MGQTVNLLVFTFGGSNPSSPTLILCGSSSVGRAQPCQGWGREFEPRLPLSQESLRDCDLRLFLFRDSIWQS